MEDTGVYTFVKSIYLKLNVIAWLVFELCYCDVAVQHISHNTTGNPHKKINADLWVDWPSQPAFLPIEPNILGQKSFLESRAKLKNFQLHWGKHTINNYINRKGREIIYWFFFNYFFRISFRCRYLVERNG